jgi:deoxycytidine triphosphate deaminase
MIIEPRKIAEIGILTSELPLDENQFQPNGIDLRVQSICRLANNSECFHLGCKGNKSLPVEKCSPTLQRDGSTKFKLFALEPYVVTCYEHVKLPTGMVAYVYGRSTLNRNGIFARSSLYDAGFCNLVGFTLYPFRPMLVEPKARIAQIVFMEAQYSTHLYDGQYQEK